MEKSLRKAQPFDGGFSMPEAKRAAAALKIDFDEVDWDLKAFAHGMNAEREHADVSKDAKVLGKIARSHLEEDPRYYEKLARMEKSLTPVAPDPFGVHTVWADLTAKRPDELEFSKWLHSMPFHEVSEAELEDLLQPTEPTEEEEAEDAQAASEQGGGGGNPDEDPNLPEKD
jgi:hypothetical protein